MIDLLTSADNSIPFDNNPEEKRNDITMNDAD
jgi:hypothetical protein